MSYGEKISVLDSRMSSIDDRLVRMEMNQERLIQDVCATYTIPLREYHFAYNLEDIPHQD